MWFTGWLSALCLATLALGATKQDKDDGESTIKSIGVCGLVSKRRMRRGNQNRHG